MPTAESSNPPGGGRKTRRRDAVAGLAIAGAIVAAAWFVGAREGFDSIGKGGGFQSILPKVGEKAPDFATEDVFGNPVRLSDFAGQPVWLMFWGSWCPPCRAEFPDIEAAYQQVAPRGVRMLGVSLREPAIQAGAYAGQNGATFLVLSDPDGADTTEAYPILNFPTHIFIDSDGIIRSIVLEDMDTDQAVAQAEKIIPGSS